MLFQVSVVRNYLSRRIIREGQNFKKKKDGPAVYLSQR